MEYKEKMMEEIRKCPVCGGDMVRGRRHKESFVCDSCRSLIPEKELDHYENSNELPPEYLLDKQSIGFMNFDLAKCSLALFCISFCIIGLRHMQSGWTVTIIIFGVIAMLADLFFHHFFHLSRMEKRDGRLWLSAGIDKLAFHKDFDLKRIRKVHVRTRREHMRTVSGLFLDLDDNTQYVFANGSKPMRLVYLRDWFNGKKFKTRQQTAGKERNNG